VAKNKKKKVRVAFHKNRNKRRRNNNLTRHIDDESSSINTEDLAASERYSGKGDLTRNRTVISTEGDGDEVLIDVDPSACRTGRVLSATGLNSIVQDDNGKRFECTVRRLVRTMSRDARNAVVAGDSVLFQALDEQYGVIERVNPRHGALSRGSQRREHIIVANVDQIVIVSSAAEPRLKQNLIDRLLVSSEKGEVPVIICVNKVDLVDRSELMPIAGLYGRIGYNVILTSTKTGQGIDYLRQLMHGRESVFTGQSGVGKSSLLNAIQPGLGLATANVSRAHEKGRHTTRRAQLLPLETGGWLVDTPGIRQLELWDVIAEEVEGFFIEFRPFVAKCKFPDCSHIHESDCGVKLAVANGLISSARYESYFNIVDDFLDPRR